MGEDRLSVFNVDLKQIIAKNVPIDISFIILRAAALGYLNKTNNVSRHGAPLPSLVSEGAPPGSCSQSGLFLFTNMTLSNSNTLFPLLLYPSFPSLSPAFHSCRTSLLRPEMLVQSLNFAADDTFDVNAVLFGVKVSTSCSGADKAKHKNFANVLRLSRLLIILIVIALFIPSAWPLEVRTGARSAIFVGLLALSFVSRVNHHSLLTLRLLLLLLWRFFLCRQNLAF